MSRSRETEAGRKLESERADLVREGLRAPGVAEVVELHRAAQAALGHVASVTTVRTWSTTNRTNA